MLDHLGLTTFETYALWAVLGVAILGLLYALFLRRQVLREDTGTPQMREVWDAIRTGADAYLNRQLRTILPFIVILTVLLFLSVYIVPPSIEAHVRFPELDDAQLQLWMGFGRAVAFIMGAAFCLTVGQIGMRMAVQANVRVAAEARNSFGGALRIAYRAGTITGMLTDGLGLLGGTLIFMYLRHRRAGRAAGLRLRRHAAGAVHARGRRHLHQGRRRRRRPGRQGRAGHPRRRPAQRRRDRRPGRRQRRRLRRYGRRHLRVATKSPSSRP